MSENELRRQVAERLGLSLEELTTWPLKASWLSTFDGGAAAPAPPSEATRARERALLGEVRHGRS